MNFKKILITGASGQLGNSLKKKLKKNYIIYPFNKKKFDITNKNLILKEIDKINPDVLINCGAFTDVSLAQIKRKEAYDVNSLGPLNLAKICNKKNILFIHFSTDYVFFGNKKSKYNESNLAIPKSYYGFTKLKGEQFIKKNAKKYIILRVSWLYYENFDNFVTKIVKFYKSKKDLYVTRFEMGIPTYCDDVSDAISIILNNYFHSKLIYGIYHYTSKGKPITRFTFANQILKLLKNKYKQNFSLYSNRNNLNSIRPNNSALEAQKIRKSLNIKLPNWKISLEKMISKHKI